MSLQQSFEEEFELDRTEHSVQGVRYLLPIIVYGGDTPVALQNITVVQVLTITVPQNLPVPPNFWADFLALMTQGRPMA